MFCSAHTKRLGALVAGAAVAFQMVSCGTLLYPERRGQPAGRLDPGVVLLDAAGLLLFFVPGVVAFAVDFSTGAIYLPGQYADAGPSSGDRPLRTVRLSPAELTQERLEAVIQEHTGRTVRLEPGTYRAARLNDVQEFTPATLERLQSAQPPARVLFSGEPSPAPTDHP